jgi:uncharacterized membrane protein
MAKSLENDLEALVKDGILSEDAVAGVRQWYAQKNATNPNRLILIFGVLGVLLVGSGISLLVAHNWDEMSIPVKTFFAFLPLVIGQVWVGYTLLKNRDSEMHREMSAGWLALAIGTSIALVSQIYHLPGNMAAFLLTWLLLGLPLVYLLRSSVASLLFIAGATWYGVEAGYEYKEGLKNTWMYWLLIAAVLPHYYTLFRARPAGWFTVLHHYAVPVSLLICLGILAVDKNGDWMWVAYMSLLGIFYLMGHILTQKVVTGISNAYRIIGWAGIMLLLFMGSFHDFWKEFSSNYGSAWLSIVGLSFFVAIGLTLAGLALLVILYKRNAFSGIDPAAPAFLLYLVLFLVGGSSPFIASFLANIYLLATGVVLLIRGQQQERLAILNLGLGIIAVLATCRFLDTDLSFIVRGVMFILVGAGFVYFNYQLIQKKKSV